MFNLNPIDGETHVIEDREYVFDGVKNTWKKSALKLSYMIDTEITQEQEGQSLLLSNGVWKNGGATVTAPPLVGDDTSTELTTNIITIQNYEPLAEYTILVSAGTFVNNNDGTITWEIPAYTGIIDKHTMTIQSKLPGTNLSAKVEKNVTITEVVTDRTYLLDNLALDPRFVSSGPVGS